MHSHTCTCMYIISMCTHTHTHTRTHTHTHSRVHMYTQCHTHNAHTCTHAYTQSCEAWKSQPKSSDNCWGVPALFGHVFLLHVSAQAITATGGDIALQCKSHGQCCNLLTANTMLWLQKQCMQLRQTMFYKCSFGSGYLLLEILFALL